MQAVFLLHSVALLLQPSRARAEYSGRYVFLLACYCLACARGIIRMILLWIMSEGVSRARDV